MRWNEDHDLLLCREVLFIKPYQYKPGTKESGSSWNLVSEDLNSTQDLIFSTTQKSVRDRFRLLVDKHKKKMRDEEASSGLQFEETELDNLLQNINDEMKVYLEKYETLTKEKQTEKQQELQKAEEVRDKAMESFSETNKRRNTSPEENSFKFKRNNGSETLCYLKAHCEQNYVLKKEEMELKKAELEIQQQQQHMMQQQQQMLQQQMLQQNKVLTSMLERFVNK